MISIILDIMSIFSLVLTIFMGLMIGVTTSALFYTYKVIHSSRKDNPLSSDLPEEITDIMDKYHLKYKRNASDAKEGKYGYTLNLTKEIVNDISLIYFQESEHSMFELSIEESVELVTYITKRIDSILNRPGIRVMKRLKVSQVLHARDLKDKVVNSKWYKITPSANKYVRGTLKVINLINPVYWFKQIIIKLAFGISANLINKEIITIVTEEAYKVYSKSLFMQDRPSEDAFAIEHEA